MIDRFAELLNELGQELGATLHPDRLGACKLKINDDITIQLECDGPHEKLLVASFICDVPPGKLRENILKDALKSNAVFAETGTLGYSLRNNKLALFKYFKLSALTGKVLAEFILTFIDKIQKWRAAVESGTTATLAPTSSTSSGIFGLKK